MNIWRILSAFERGNLIYLRLTTWCLMWNSKDFELIQRQNQKGHLGFVFQSGKVTSDHIELHSEVCKKTAHFLVKKLE